MFHSRGAYVLYRHVALFNALALSIAAGEVQNALIEIPPQHGKSQYWSRYFPAWWSGTFPEERVVLASYEASYAASWGRAARDVLEELGPELFGVAIRQDTHAADDWSLDGHEGGMTTSGLDGPLTGRRGDLAIIDDPIKGHQEAESKTRKDHIWDWWDSTLSTRMSKNGKRIVLMTRWAEDDLIGRILMGAKPIGNCQYLTPAGEVWTVIRLPAIADEDEDWPQWGWKRTKGEVLCPERFPLEVLEKRRAKSDYWWATLYQQLPYAREGGHLKLEWLNGKIVNEVPKGEATVRAWDLAGSEDPGAKRTAGCKITRTKDKNYFIEDFVVGRWSPGARDKVIRLTAEADGKDVRIPIEQEPGSGGKSQVETIAALLDGFRVIPVSAARGGSKELRADGLASAAQSGRLWLKKADWNAAFLEEWRSFPGGLTVDMIDAAAHGYNELVSMPSRMILPSLPGRTPAAPSTPRIFRAGEGRIF